MTLFLNFDNLLEYHLLEDIILNLERSLYYNPFINSIRDFEFFNFRLIFRKYHF